MQLLGVTLLSRYTIEKVLGSGGFGDTYLARDTALPNSPPCVVKHLKPKDENSEIQAIAQSLFEREANTLYELGEHESIPRLFAHFEQSGEFFLVQEFIEGHDLSIEFQPGQPWPLEAVNVLIQELLEVLSVLHQKNVIHRDVKPQNIMRRHRDGKLFLIDFGAVKEIPQLTVTEAGETALTVAIGSPGYMPSEQAVGKPNAASDIYAAGMIAIQALTGQSPMQLPTDSNTGDVLWSTQFPVPERLVSILKRMTQDHFSQRYKNAMEALAAFEQVKPDETTIQFLPGEVHQGNVSPLPTPPTEYQTPIQPASLKKDIELASSAKRKALILPWALTLTGLIAFGAGLAMMIQSWKGQIQVTSGTKIQNPQESTVDIKIQRNQVDSPISLPLVSTHAPNLESKEPDNDNNRNESLPSNAQKTSNSVVSDTPLTSFSSNGEAFVIDPPSNIRLVPNGEILCTVPKPQIIPISDSHGDWYPTTYCGQPGVIHSSQLKFKGQPALVIDPPSNVRSQPNGDIICAVEQTSQIEVYGQTQDWYRTNVCDANIIGYIHKSQITFD